MDYSSVPVKYSKNDFTASQPITVHDFERADTGVKRNVQQKWTSKHCHNFSSTWWWEIACAIWSLLSLLAIVLVLRLFDGKPLSDWNSKVRAGRNAETNVSLNVIISILGTSSKTSLAVILPAGLAQAKWNWFAQKDRPLRDFNMFDSAVLGAQGSVNLLWRTKARRLASVGAALMILSLAFNPFIQLLVDYSGETVDDPNSLATISHARMYSRGNEDARGVILQDVGEGISVPGYRGTPDPEFVAAFYNGLWNPSARQRPDFRCDGGNCTYPDYVSLAVCHSCHDVSEHLNLTDLENQSITAGVSKRAVAVGIKMLEANLGSRIPVSIKNQYGRDHTDGEAMGISGTFETGKTFNFQDSETLLYSFAILRASKPYIDGESNWEDSKVEAMECGLLLCSKTYSSSVTNGVFSENVTESNSRRVPASYQTVIGENLSNQTFSPVRGGPIIPREDFQIELSEQQAAIASVDAFNVTQVAIDSHTDWIDVTLGTGLVGMISSRRFSFEPPVSQALYMADSLDTLFSSVAEDLSAAIRTAGVTPSNLTVYEGRTGALDAPATGQAESATAGIVQPLAGNAQKYITVIKVSWGFIAMPALLCIFGTAFLFAAMWQTRRANTPLYKENSLPALVWGLEKETREQARREWNAHGVDGMDAFKVRFKGNRDGGQLFMAAPPDSDYEIERDTRYRSMRGPQYTSLGQQDRI